MASSKSGSKNQSSSQSDCDASSQVTVDHEEIRRWVEERGGHPACVKGTDSGNSCLLRIDYPGFGGDDRLEPMDWEDFFHTFDQQNLAFLYQETTKDCDPSRFSKLISRGSAPGEEGGGGGRGRSSGNKSGGKSRQNGGGSRGEKSSRSKSSR
jgi:hypothetical protein